MPDDAARQLAAHDLLCRHAARTAAGHLDDAAEIAAVVGVERVAAAAGTTDEAGLLALLDLDPLSCPPDQRDLADLVTEVHDRVRTGLERREVGHGPDSAMVNKDSGHHPIATEAERLRVAVRAASTTYAAMPYYSARYGARGSRFAGSDSAWLVSLATTVPRDAVRHVEWLAGVLAARGMPSWLLERHLGDLVDALVDTVGPQAPGALRAAVAALRERRRAHVEDDLLDRADRWLDEAVGDRVPVSRTGALLASAAADVASGLVRDDTSLVAWLTDPDRVQPEVAAAVLHARARVAERVRVGPVGPL